MRSLLFILSTLVLLPTSDGSVLNVTCDSVSSCLAAVPDCADGCSGHIGTTNCDPAGIAHRLIITCINAGLPGNEYDLYRVTWHGECSLDPDPIPNVSTWNTYLRSTYISIHDCDSCPADPPRIQVQTESPVTLARVSLGPNRYLTLIEESDVLGAVSTSLFDSWSWPALAQALAERGFARVNDVELWPLHHGVFEVESDAGFQPVGKPALFRSMARTVVLQMADFGGTQRRPALGVVSGRRIDWSAASVLAALQSAGLSVE